MDENIEFNPLELEAVNYFLSLKKNYEGDRQPLEHGWNQALVAVFGFDPSCNDKLDRVYNGLSNIQSPIMNWKVNGMTSRIDRILFNAKPIGRIEDSLVAGPEGNNLVDLWNSYIFSYQLD